MRENDTIIELAGTFREFERCYDADDIMKAVDRADGSRETEEISEEYEGHSETFGERIRITKVRGSFTVHGRSGRSYSGTWHGIQTESAWDEEDGYTLATISVDGDSIEIDGITYELEA